MTVLLCEAILTKKVKKPKDLGDRVKHSIKPLLDILLLIDCIHSSMTKTLFLEQLLFFKLSGVTWLQ